MCADDAVERRRVEDVVSSNVVLDEPAHVGICADGENLEGVNSNAAGDSQDIRIAYVDEGYIVRENESTFVIGIVKAGICACYYNGGWKAQ